MLRRLVEHLCRLLVFTQAGQADAQRCQQFRPDRRIAHRRSGEACARLFQQIGGARLPAAAGAGVGISEDRQHETLDLFGARRLCACVLRLQNRHAGTRQQSQRRDDARRHLEDGSG